MLRLLALASFLLPSLAVADDITHFTLDNGMEVIVLEDHRAPVVVHMVWYKAGAADEPPGKSGIAHYLEHLLFKGTDELAPGEFSETVAAHGGTDNAFTSWDYTAYFQRVAADRLELMMKMESDRMVDLILDEKDILTERDVVLEERAQRTDSDPDALFGEQRRAAQYLSHPYGIPIIGWRHEADALTLEDALSFYGTYYAPNNAILVVAGDVESDQVKALAETYYGVIPANPDLRERARPQEPPQLAERRMTYVDPRISQPYVMRTYLAPERDSGDQEKAAALSILAQLLGGSQATSVLGRKLSFDKQVSIYSSAFYNGMALDDTTFGLIIVPAEGISLEEGEAYLDEAIAEFMEEGVDTDQFERLKMEMRAARIYAQDAVQSRARRYGRALTSGLTVQDVQDWPEILQAVTVEDVMAAAAEIFDRKKAVTGWLTNPQSQEASK